jgi:hypothetical protein
MERGAGMSSPIRIQRKRTKGWRKPEGAVIVDRTSKWGNPFTVEAARAAGYDNPQEVSVQAFRDWLVGIPWACGIGDQYAARRKRILSEIATLQGCDLVCPCELDAVCHADVLLKLAN